jgi:hypothetical protein
MAHSHLKDAVNTHTKAMQGLRAELLALLSGDKDYSICFRYERIKPENGRAVPRHSQISRVTQKTIKDDEIVSIQYTSIHYSLNDPEDDDPISIYVNTSNIRLDDLVNKLIGEHVDVITVEEFEQSAKSMTKTLLGMVGL